MVKAQVKGYSMQSDAQKWSTPPADGTWSPTTSAAGPAAAKAPHNPGLKRPRSSSNAMESLPPAPKLRGDIILEVFTHKSLRFPGAPIDEDSEFGDNERLSILGEKVLELAVTSALFSKRPMLKAEDIEIQRHETLSDTNIENWVAAYKMREKVRCSADAVLSLSTPKEARLLFHSYVGGIFAQNGMGTIQNWIGQLVDPNYEPDSGQAFESEVYNAYKKIKTEAMASPPPPSMPPPPPPPPSQPPPPMPMPTMNPLAPAQPQTAFLPLFNQTANQRRLTVEYPATFTGPAHAGRWTVQCVVNGMPKGEGAGASKQLAKEEAARQAYYAMGWAPRA